MSAIHRGREYYQSAIFKKTLFEQLLGLNRQVPGFSNPNATLAIATTRGMQEVGTILAGRPPRTFWARLRRSRIVTYVIWLLILLALIDLIGLGYCVSRVVQLVMAPAAASADADQSIAAHVSNVISVTSPASVQSDPARAARQH